MTIKRFVLGFVAASMLFAFGTSETTCQSEKPPDKHEEFLGTVKDGVYRNAFFGFSLKIPANFFPLTEGENTAYENAGASLLAAGIQKNRDAWEKAAKAEISLLGISEKSPGALGNSSLFVGAIRQREGVSPRMVANVSKEFILKSPNFRVANDTKELRRGDKPFATFDLIGTVGETVFRTRYYVTILRNHSVTFVITSVDDKVLASFESVLESLSFTPESPPPPKPKPKPKKA